MRSSRGQGAGRLPAAPLLPATLRRSPPAAGGIADPSWPDGSGRSLGKRDHRVLTTWYHALGATWHPCSLHLSASAYSLAWRTALIPLSCPTQTCHSSLAPVSHTPFDFLSLFATYRTGSASLPSADVGWRAGLRGQSELVTQILFNSFRMCSRNQLNLFYFAT